jgi:hypothetical protein
MTPKLSPALVRVVGSGQVHLTATVDGRSGRLSFEACNLDDATALEDVREDELVDVDAEGFCGHCFPGGRA